MVTRRTFMASILAACVAPAIVRADALMRIVPRETLVLYGISGSALGFNIGRIAGMPPIMSEAEARKVAERMFVFHYFEKCHKT